MKLQEFEGRYSVTIPKEIVKLKRWNKGTKLILVLDRTGALLIVEDGQ